MRFTDPSGHGIPWEEVVAIILVFIGGGAVYDDRRRHESPEGATGCQGTLAECFNNGELKDFSDHEQIDQGEFSDMLDAICEDLQGEIRTPYDYARMTYDTPLFDGNGQFVDDERRTDQVVCFGEECYNQSAVNYVAQGMYTAASGQSLEDAMGLADDWNHFWYHHYATEEELYWLEYGYNYYLENQDK